MDSIGNRVRALRKARGLSLKRLAELVGCTPSYLSMVENDKLDPSVSRLKKIVDSLGCTIVEMFSEARENHAVVLRKEDRQKVVVQGSRLIIEILVRQDPGKKLDARLAVIAPGGASQGDYSHPGEEFGYVLKGSLELTVDGRTYVLNYGDTFHFDSTRHHRFRNVTEEDVEVLWVNHPPSW